MRLFFSSIKALSTTTGLSRLQRIRTALRLTNIPGIPPVALILVCSLFVFSGDGKTDAPDASGKSFKSLKIGINLGIIRRMDEYGTDAILKRIASDGFRHVRIMDPFSSDYETKLFRRLHKLANLGFYVDFNMGNFPRAMVPSNEIRQAYIHSVLGNKYFPAKKIVRNRKRLAKTTETAGVNRFPPQDMEAYKKFLIGFFKRLEREFGKRTLSHWFFEFGNEPDAPLYFFGRPEDYQRLTLVSLGIAKQVVPYMQAGIGGYTSTLVTNHPMAERYYTLARQLAMTDNNDFLSFHVYYKHHKNDIHILDNNVRAFAGDINKPKMITEFNVTAGHTEFGKAVMLSKQRFMGYLIDMAAVCWKNGVTHLFIHNLRDHPKKIKKHKVKVGLFYAAGAPGNHGTLPKDSYRALVLMKAVVEPGFQLIERDNAIVLKGKNRTLIKATVKDSRFDASRYKALDYSFVYTPGSTTIPKGEWILLKNR